MPLDTLVCSFLVNVLGKQKSITVVQSKEGGVVLKAKDSVVYLGENFYGYGLTTPLVDPNAPPVSIFGDIHDTDG